MRISLLIVFLLILAGGLNAGTNTSAGTIPASAFTGACGPLPPPSWPNFKTRLDAFVMADCYGVQKQNWPHEADRPQQRGSPQPLRETVVLAPALQVDDSREPARSDT